MIKLTGELRKRRLEFLKSYKCKEPGCYRFRAHGYVYCKGHIHGFSSLMIEDDIEILKEAGL